MKSQLTGDSQNPLVGNKRTTAEVLVIDEQSHLPFITIKGNKFKNNVTKNLAFN